MDVSWKWFMTWTTQMFVSARTTHSFNPSITLSLGYRLGEPVWVDHSFGDQGQVHVFAGWDCVWWKCRIWRNGSCTSWWRVEACTTGHCIGYTRGTLRFNMTRAANMITALGAVVAKQYSMLQSVLSDTAVKFLLVMCISTTPSCPGTFGSPGWGTILLVKRYRNGRLVPGNQKKNGQMRQSLSVENESWIAYSHCWRCFGTLKRFRCAHRE